MANRPAEALLRNLGGLFLGALLVVAPFAVSLTAENAFRLPKLLLSEWLGLASLVAYGLAAAVARDAGPAVPPWRRRVVLAVVPVLAAASVGLLASEQPVQTREGLADLWIAGACLAGWSLALPGRRLERFLAATVVSGSLMALLGVLQFHGIFQPFRFTTVDETRRLGITALAGNPGDLGAFLVLPALVAQWNLLRTLRRGHRGGGWTAWAWAAAAVVCLYGVVATQTLTAVAAVAVAATVFWLLALPRRAAVTAALVAASLALGVVGTVPPLRARAVQVGELVAGGEWNRALTGRLDGWRAALWMFREHPWTGVGHGAYASRFAAAKIELQERGVAFFTGHGDPFFANAHNDFLEALAEWGLLGAAALAWALVLLGRALVARGPPAAGRDLAGSGAFAWAATAAAAVLAVAHFPFHLALVAYPYLVVFAWVFRRGAEGAEVEA